MNLTIGDMAALSGMTGSMMAALGIAVRYFVKTEIECAINALRLELAKDRADVLANAAARLLIEQGAQVKIH